MSTLSLSLTMGAVGGPSSLAQRAINVLRKYGSNATLYLPGVGTMNGIQAGNYIDSLGTVPGAYDSPLGYVTDSFGGRHATQATAASKPTLRRGLVNLLTYSNGFSNAAWGKLDVSAIGSPSLTPDGGTTFKVSELASTAIHRMQFALSVTSGTAYTGCVYVKADGRKYLRVNFGTAFNAIVQFDLDSGTVSNTNSGTGVITPIGGGWFLCAVTGMAGSTQTTSGYIELQTAITTNSQTYAGDGTSGILLHRAALFTGTVTAQQILSAGGIPVTTTAPASSTAGKPYWEFDGNDFLQTGITTGNEGWICAGVTPVNTTTAMSVVNAGEGTTTVPGIWLVGNGTGGWALSAANGTTRNHANIAVAGAVPQVVSGGWNASGLFAGVNANESATTARTGDCSSGANVLRLGMYQGSSIPLNGSMSAALYFSVLPSAADRAILRKWVGSLQGQTL